MKNVKDKTMTQEELLEVLDILDLDYDLKDPEDLDWLDRVLGAINRRFRELKRKRKRKIRL